MWLEDLGDQVVRSTDLLIPVAIRKTPYPFGLSMCFGKGDVCKLVGKGRPTKLDVHSKFIILT